MSELLDIFDEKFNKIGVKERKEVHEKGYWHQTFHCWLVDKNAEFIVFQLRSKNKGTHPSKLDVTAAGHLLTNEMIEDGVRELEEEIGVHLSLGELRHVETFKATSKRKNYINNEFCHLYLYQTNQSLEEFVLQEEEVEALFQFNINEMKALFNQECTTIKGKGIHGNEEFSLDDFVPHGKEYFQKIWNALNNK